MQIVRASLLAIAGATACRFTNIADLPEPPAFRIVVEPDTVRARITAQQRIQLDFVVRIFNDGPGACSFPPADTKCSVSRLTPRG